MLLASTGCGATKTVTVPDRPKIPPGYLDPTGTGIRIELDDAQIERIVSDITHENDQANRAPDLFAPVGRVDLVRRPSDPPGAVRMTYTFKCSFADFGYEVVLINRAGRERIITPTTASTDQYSDKLCLS